MRVPVGVRGPSGWECHYLEGMAPHRGGELDAGGVRGIRRSMSDPIALRSSRPIAGTLAVALSLVLGLAGGCHHESHWHATEVSGVYPRLAFTMTRAMTDTPVTAADFRGRVVMLYFGFTKCQSICPVTLSNVARLFQRLGPTAKRVRMLFVTVDPDTDTPSVLASYVRHFGPEVVGLRGDADQLTRLARRYRVGFSVTPKSPGQAYRATHSSAIYVFDGAGNARLLISSFTGAHPDIAGIAADLKRLVGEQRT